MKNYLLIGSASLLLTLSCSKKEDAPAPNPKPEPAPTSVNLRSTTAKPSAKPNVAVNVKNEASKSTRVTSASPQSADKDKNGATVTLQSANPSNAQSVKVMRGNTSSQRAEVDGAMQGWSISEVYIMDEFDPSDTIFVVSNNPKHYDADHDGIEDINDLDDDNDGILDTEDTDDDGDGILDINEDGDADNDGILDVDDLDDDNDGILDVNEVLAIMDSDGDGINDDLDTDDDNDGIPDTEDTDDDGDGISDEDEDDFASLDSEFDLSLFFFANGEYITYDASDSNDAWDWGNWYSDATGKYISLDLGTDAEELYEIESISTDGSSMLVSTYDEDSDLKVYIKLATINLN
ncbi:MAG: hypothetical protein EAZ27_04485 [Cytophagales bacterium]|nr:MAG: hypothetical protein EAZ27_04485 [Cytophagales bacterium]